MLRINDSYMMNIDLGELLGIFNKGVEGTSGGTSFAVTEREICLSQRYSLNTESNSSLNGYIKPYSM